MAPRKPPPLSLPSIIHSSDEDTLQLSSPESSSSLTFDLALVPDTDSTSSDATSSDDISKDLAVLEKLRKSVQKNLRLRPIKSNSNLKATSSSWRAQDSILSPVSSTSSVYYTPISPPSNARQPIPIPPSRATPAIEPSSLHDILSTSRPRRPLMIDTRPPALYLSSHIRHSINIAIPSLILKRYRKAGQNGGFQSLAGLRQFITTEQGKASWDVLMHRPGGNGESTWNGSVVVYDEEMNEREKENAQATAWALIPLITPLVHDGGTVEYLKGGFSAARNHHRLKSYIVSDEPDSSDEITDDVSRKSGSGLFQLNTDAASRVKPMPELEQDRPAFVHSPMPMMPAAMTTNSSTPAALDSDPSPPPSQLSFRRPAPPKRPSVPNLRRLDTKSAERLNINLPKLQIRTPPLRAATLSVPPSLHIATNGSSLLQPPQSPSFLNLSYSTHSPNSPNGSSFRDLPPPTPSPGINGQSSFHDLPPPPPSFSSSRASSPRTPITPMPRSPATARPDIDGFGNAPLTTEDAFPAFTISVILPNFLYLGPELTTPEHVEQLKALGVKRILNIAIECDDDHGLGLRDVFERYFHIPMRDTVEEDNITRGVREACDILG
ncbi:hypothetical protein HWV62_19369 [Athelia sp. TMB]|nr:hypothetical protein HWV62_19369 [Athelia sp. TMB]